MQQITPAAAAPFAPYLAELDCFSTARQRLERRNASARATLTEMAAERDERLSQYRADLSVFDWHFEMSDCITTWRAATRMLATLRATQADLDVDGATWRSIAPQGNLVPQPVVVGAAA